ncbi:MAG TPA: hypothetical protein VHW01_05455, partial [Polyangiaceae bacterium]|nr:hypothetical protein [Polyangiaceae bacterium]
PATVVCAVCGNPDCVGCGFDEPTNASGVVAIIPWERRGVGFFRRLWQTSTLATVHARTFFGSLPDGDVSPALAFALVCEAVAVSGLGLCAGLLALLFLPALPGLMLDDPTLRHTVVRGVLSGVLVLMFAMVSVHAAHGVALDVAARRFGGRSSGRGLRFGLYACGWDLVTLPFGLLTTALLDGMTAARRAAPLGLTAPLSAAQAYLIGLHGLTPDTARLAARRAAYFTAVPLLVILVAGAVVVALALR